MSWINKILPSIMKQDQSRNKRNGFPEGIWSKCTKCEAILYKEELEKNLMVCPKCEHHMSFNARKRLENLFDDETWEEFATDIEPVDYLKFKDIKKYKERLSVAQKKTSEKDALIAMSGEIHELKVIAVAFDFSFHGGSMGGAVGKKFTLAAQKALDENIPFICFSASGGARMQEALISLMQMAKTSAILERLKKNGVPYISVMTDPVYGGVSASLALLGDINIAEPDSRVGFAGPNIIEQTIRQKLPEGFQRAEFLLDHGAIDMIVKRSEIKGMLKSVLSKLTANQA